ncbi:MAG: Ig-like domain-containing protein [Candidatus Zixiibacteriota bacterium]
MTCAVLQYFRLFAVCLMCLFLDDCADHKNSTASQKDAVVPIVTAVSPVNGATSVSRRASIGMRFNTTMDTGSVMGAFHLAGGTQMDLWMDSVGHHQGMGGMGMMDMDHMMQWLDSIQYPGQWHWNGVRDSCWFVPDSLLLPNANHMIYLYGSMRSHDGMMMNTDSMSYGGPMYHFHTQQ